MAAGCVVVKPRAARTPTVAAQQVRRHASLVEKHVLTGIMQRKAVSPVPSLHRNVSAPLFVGVYSFF